jgi:hypothetical protein
MARGGRNINPELFREKITDDIYKVIKDIVIVQYSQITGKCPNGHKFCLSSKCWIEGFRDTDEDG